jgi:hypothetical protein
MSAAGFAPGNPTEMDPGRSLLEADLGVADGSIRVSTDTNPDACSIEFPQRFDTPGVIGWISRLCTVCWDAVPDL